MALATSRKVTIVDIAKKASVSRAAVSLVLRGQPGVGEETRARVLRAIQDLGYVYNRNAANLRQARSSVVGMVINDLSNPFFAQLAIGIERALSLAGYIPFMANTAENVSAQANHIRSMREHGAVGVILCPAIDTNAEEVRRLARDFPMVLAVRRIAGVRMACAVPENELGAERAVQHLVSLGHKRICFLGGRPAAVVRADRLAGYRTALDAAGLAFDPGLVIESDPTRLGGVEAMTAALDLAQAPTAVLCYNDIVAMGAMIASVRAGLTIGKDMAIVGFDDIAEASLVAPALTTVAINPEALGEHAARLLLDQIKYGTDAIGTYIGDARLIVRGSCGTR